MSPHHATIAAFVVWALSWFAAAFWSNQTTSRAGLGAEWLYRIVTVVGVFLIFGFDPREFGGQLRLWHFSPDVQWALFGLTLPGFAFMWWARLHLGRLWSSGVTRKEGHHVVDSGPYGIVRHPIYTGLIAASGAAAVQAGTIPALAGVVVLTLGFYIKARLEERFLREQLGAEAYDAYRRRVPMLLPFGPKSD